MCVFHWGPTAVRDEVFTYIFTYDEVFTYIFTYLYFTWPDFVLRKFYGKIKCKIKMKFYVTNPVPAQQWYLLVCLGPDSCKGQH